MYFKVPSNINTVKIAHVVLGMLAVLIIFPSGGIFINLAGDRTYKVWKYGLHSAFIHAGIQIFGYMVYISAAALGIWMGRQFQVVS